MANEISIDTTQISAWIKKVDTEVAPQIKKFFTLGLVNSANIVQRKESEEVPRGVTNNLSRSIAQMVTALTATIGPDHKMVPHYALDIEKGTKPHMPPIDAITPWANAKGINPWALAMSIKKKGTKANPFVQRTYEATKGDVILEFVGIMKLIVEFMARL